MTSRTRSSVIRRPYTSESYRTATGNSTTYLRRNIEEFREIETERVTTVAVGRSSGSYGDGGGGQSSRSGPETQSTRDGVVRTNEVRQAKADSIVHLRESSSGGGGGTTVTLSRGLGPRFESQVSRPPTLPAQTNISMKRQLTRPERHKIKGSVRERRPRGEQHKEEEEEEEWPEEEPGPRGGVSYTRAVASDGGGEAAVTVTVSDTSSVDSPQHLSPHRPLLHPPDRTTDAKLIRVELDSKSMDLDSGGRFERRTTILDR